MTDCCRQLGRDRIPDLSLGKPVVNRNQRLIQDAIKNKAETAARYDSGQPSTSQTSPIPRAITRP
jgi:hypothetical protein